MSLTPEQKQRIYDLLTTGKLEKPVLPPREPVVDIQDDPADPAPHEHERYTLSRTALLDELMELRALLDMVTGAVTILTGDVVRVEGQRDALLSCLVAYVEIEEARAPASSSPLRERSRQAIRLATEGGPTHVQA